MLTKTVLCKISLNVATYEKGLNLHRAKEALGRKRIKASLFPSENQQGYNLSHRLNAL